ncbi:hypothetical protein Ga0061079_1203 [Apibacter mensalis]|uniref:Uncharacterized protein n=1 Tax=Apibacter mensalis TaxID=1586267 RepID=A0A0X3ATG7_9FLAO|nr:hypothetical protein [Apibacter mensalis]CVK17188.1 hypothetical protein Ga0061079_1203 [Apibacter mensalis]
MSEIKYIESKSNQMQIPSEYEIFMEIIRAEKMEKQIQESINSMGYTVVENCIKIKYNNSYEEFKKEIKANEKTRL